MDEKPKKRIKHAELYIIAFVVCVIGACVAFAYGCTNINAIDPGLYEIVPNSVEEVKHFASDFSFYYYIDNEKGSPTATKTALTNLYTDKLSFYYALLNEEEEYPSYKGIGAINAHPNESVYINEYVYNILQEAYTRSSVENNFSIFANPLYAFWYRQFSLTKEEQIANDPINSEITRNFQANLASFTNSRSHIDLVFLGNNQVKLNVSNDYLNFYKDNELTAPFISLGQLKNTYILNYVSEYILSQDYQKGFIITVEGDAVIFPQATVNEYSFYSIVDKKGTYVASIKPGVPSYACCHRRFQLNTSEYPSYYVFEKDGTTYYRSLYIDISSGLSSNTYLSINIYGNDASLIASGYHNLAISKCNSISEVQAYLTSHGLTNINLAIDLNANDKTLYVTTNLKQYVTIDSELDYNLITM